MSTATWTCMLVEDNEDHAFLITKTIQKNSSLQLQRVFKSGEETIEFFRSAESSPDILFVDINLPEMNGFECIEALQSKSLLKNTKIVILTTSDAERDQKRASELEVYSYITKPLRSESLAELLRQE